MMHQRNLAGEHVEGRKQGGRPVSLIVVTKAAQGLAVGQSQIPLRPFQDLNVGLFVYRKDHGFWKAPAVVAIGLAGLLSLSPTPVSAAPSGQVVIVRGFYGPRWWYGPGWGWYGWYGPWGPPYVAVPVTGTVKIKTHDKNAAVYVDGGYAGLTAKLKKFALRPGNHDIELRDSRGHTFYQERIQVIAGRTIEIHPGYLG